MQVQSEFAKPPFEGSLNCMRPWFFAAQNIPQHIFLAFELKLNNILFISVESLGNLFLGS